MTNRLKGETSPYLLQHKDNPVHWWPWGPEALAEAKSTGKPILLSVGYAACHWCHVMAHESFENPEIAALMNAHFINVKVDREERPDLDAIYQQALAMTGQHGGWPLTMFLTPDADPFWGGTYFPPAPRYGRPGFPDVLRGVSQTWTKAPDKVSQNVEALRNGLTADQQLPPDQLSLDMADMGARRLLDAVDTEHGGLGGAPKFPQPNLFDFMWRSALRTGDAALSQAVTLTLDHMCRGGIYDHLGGGFMRYSTEETWLVPHFEKMLYDNAQLVELLTHVWQETENDLYRARVAETVEWLLRDMMGEGGAFAATLDADSEGVEGKFYVWDVAEIDRLLDAESARWFKLAYDVRPGGNWEGHSILQRNHRPQSTDVEDLLADARAVLWRERESRIHPGRDDKILADWNGMMIAALAQAGFVFAMPRWIDAARTAFETIRKLMTLPGHRLSHSLRLGRTSATGLIDDLAHMSRAALALYEATGDATLVEQARLWVEAADQYHWDGLDGGYFQTVGDARDVIVRLKPIHDNAVPAANGIMIQVLARLAQITGETRYHQRAEAALAAFSGRAQREFANMTSLFAGFEQLADPVQIVIAGKRSEIATAEMLKAVAEACLPTRILMVTEDAEIPFHHPAHGKGRINDQVTAYVCHGPVCSAPVTDPASLRERLRTR